MTEQRTERRTPRARSTSSPNDSVTLRVYAHVIRKHADGVAATFAAAVEGTTPPAATTPEEADDDPSALVAC